MHSTAGWMEGTLDKTFRDVGVGGVGWPRRVVQDVGSILGDLCSVRRARRAWPVMMAGGPSFPPPPPLCLISVTARGVLITACQAAVNSPSPCCLFPQ